MSIEYNVHLGPYLHVPAKDTHKMEDMCGHDVDGQNFCPECGRDQSDRSRSVPVAPPVVSVIEDIANGDHRLMVANEEDAFIAMISNMTNLKERPTYDPRYNHVAVPILTGFDFDEETDAFASNFAEEIASIRSVEPLAEIRWGMLMWTS